jgi:hypothetical protein
VDNARRLVATQGPDIVDPHDFSLTVLAAGFSGFSKIEKYAGRAIDTLAGGVGCTNE